MSFNQFMHPRNIYRIKPNYTQLANKYPEFRENVFFDDSGNAHVNYSDLKALRSLTKTLLKNDFNLDVEIPEGRLVPTLPMRLNYLLWIEDLLQQVNINTLEQDEEVIGFDIGTGCCAIFPLLGTRMNQNWRFLASDIDEINLKYSRENIERNSLQDRIKVFQNNSEKMFFDEILNSLNQGQKINFTMTNPPFFENDSELSMSIPSNSKIFHDKKIQETSSNESTTDGGEVAFVKKIIQESISIADKIELYTVLLGRKKSFNELKDLLVLLKTTNVVKSFTSTELCQGNTKRWALAWSFSQDSLANLSPRKFKTPKQLSWIITRTSKLKPHNMDHILEIVKNILEELKVEFNIVQLKRWYEIEIKSNTNTWSNQRRKRRQLAHMSDVEMQHENDHISATPKREHESDDGDENDDDLMKIDHSEENKSFKKTNQNLSGICKTDLTVLLHCVLTIKRYQSEIKIEMCQKEMCRDNDSMHQLFQFLKNRLSQ